VTFELIQELPQVHVLQVKLNGIFIVLQLSIGDIVADRLPRVGLNQLVLVKSAHSLGMSFPNEIPRSRQSADVLVDRFDGEFRRRLFLALTVLGLTHPLKASEILQGNLFRHLLHGLHGTDPKKTPPHPEELFKGAFTRLVAGVPSVVVPLDTLKLGDGHALVSPTDIYRLFSAKDLAGDPLCFLKERGSR
jgi:hypothetical protein